MTLRDTSIQRMYTIAGLHFGASGRFSFRLVMPQRRINETQSNKQRKNISRGDHFRTYVDCQYNRPSSNITCPGERHSYACDQLVTARANGMHSRSCHIPATLGHPEPCVTMLRWSGWAVPQATRKSLFVGGGSAWGYPQAAVEQTLLWKEGGVAK